MIFTIGHSNHATKDFIDLLRRSKVTILVDVRTSPRSKYTPQYDKNALSKAVNQAGISYEWRGQVLGGLNRIPVDDPLFVKEMQGVVRRGETENIALMCSESDPAKCHRAMKLSSWVLRNSRQNVTHILKEGTIDGREFEKKQKEGWLHEGFKTLEFSGDQLSLDLGQIASNDFW